MCLASQYLPWLTFLRNVVCNYNSADILVPTLPSGSWRVLYRWSFYCNQFCNSDWKSYLNTITKKMCQKLFRLLCRAAVCPNRMYIDRPMSKVIFILKPSSLQGQYSGKTLLLKLGDVHGDTKSNTVLHSIYWLLDIVVHIRCSVYCSLS